MYEHPRWLSEEEEKKRNKRIVYLRDKSHLVSGDKQLTWRVIGERFGIKTDAAIKAYKKSKEVIKNET